jgi:hypothetical protein
MQLPVLEPFGVIGLKCFDRASLDEALPDLIAAGGRQQG